MLIWKDDHELFSIMKENLFVAVIGDVMDQMGYYHQFLPPEIRPISQDMVLAGRAMTVLEKDYKSPGEFGSDEEKPFGLMFEALDSLKEDEVYVCSGSSPTYALVGELMLTRASILGAAGCVVNGYLRDTNGILKIGIPSFAMGGYAQDQAPRGRVIAYRVDINFGGVHISPGDIVFGDIDGVVIIPKQIEQEVIQRAYKKATEERLVEKAIRSGMSASQAFAEYGVM